MKRALQVGCGCFNVIAIIAGIVVLTTYRAVVAKSEKAMARFEATYASAKAHNLVSAEDVQLLDRFLDSTQAPEHSIWSRMLTRGFVKDAIVDGKLSADELRLKDTIHRFVLAHPDCSFMEMSFFARAHPEFMEIKRRNDGQRED